MLAHNRALVNQIITQADAMQFEIVSPRDEARRGGSAMIRLPDEVDPAELIGKLRSQRLFADCRGQTLRLSPGAITTSRCVDRLFEALHRVAR